MNDGGTRTGTCVVRSDDVVVERTVAQLDRGVIVTVEAESTGTGPTAFTLTDEFPEGLPVSDAGFQPGTEPPGGGVDSDRATVEAVVTPEQGYTGIYALQFYETVPEVDLGEPELVEADPRTEEPSGDPSVVARDGSTAVTSRAPAEGETTPGPDPAEAEAKPTMSEREPESEAEPHGDDPEPRSETSGREPAPESPESEPESDPEPPADGGKRIGATLGLFSGDRGGRRGGGHRSRRTAGAASSDGGAVDGVQRTARSGGRDGADTTTSNWSATGTIDSAGGGTGTDATEGVAAALVEELREGSVNDDEIDALRRELGTEPTASDDVRIEHLQARVGEFEAYAEDLRAVIDEHGSAETFVDGFDGRLDGLREDLEAVETELSATREAVEAFEERLEAVEAFREEFSAVFTELGEGPG